MKKEYIVFFAIVIFASVLFIINTIHQYNFSLLPEKKYQRPIKDLIEWEVPKVFFEEDETKKEEKEEDKQKQEDEENGDPNKVIGHRMTRSELGNHGWALLHMIGQTFPNKVDDAFLQKTNVFLNLFGQFYPCKECGGHFLKMIRSKPFKGHTREEFKIYVCELHNIVNVRLGKQVVDCIVDYPTIWGETCGCMEDNSQN